MRHPLRQRHQLLVQQRFLVQHRLKITNLHIRRGLGVDRRHYSDELLVFQRRNHARSTQRALRLAHRIGERAVQRHGQRDFAISGHERQDSV